MNMPTGVTGEESSLPVVCDLCGTRMYVSDRHLGKRVKCPDCHSPNLVKPRPPKPQPRKSVLLDDKDAYRLAADEPKGGRAATRETSSRSSGAVSRVRDPSDVIPVHCGTCGTLMYARSQHVGKRIRCPDCESLTVVNPPPPKPKDRFELTDASDVQVEKAPPPRVDETRKDISTRLMADAATHVAAREAEKPVPPKAPLREGLVTFMFSPMPLALWILGGFGLLVNFALLVALVDLIAAGGIATILCAFLAPMLAICFVSLLGLVAPHCLNIIEYTAEGFGKIPNWPGHDLLSRGHAILLWGNAIAVATAPGVVLVSALRAVGIPVPVAASLISIVLLLPPILLSMLLNGSAFAPFSREVFGSFRAAGHAWSAIWLYSIVSGSAVVGLSWLVQSQAPAYANYVTLFAVSAFVVFFSRLVGRMGWIISQLDSYQSSEDESDGEDEQAMGEHEIFAGDNE